MLALMALVPHNQAGIDHTWKSSQVPFPGLFHRGQTSVSSNGRQRQKHNSILYRTNWIYTIQKLEKCYLKLFNHVRWILMTWHFRKFFSSSYYNCIWLQSSVDYSIGVSLRMSPPLNEPFPSISLLLYFYFHCHRHQTEGNGWWHIASLPKDTGSLWLGKQNCPILDTASKPDQTSSTPATWPEWPIKILSYFNILEINLFASVDCLRVTLLVVRTGSSEIRKRLWAVETGNGTVQGVTDW